MQNTCINETTDVCTSLFSLLAEVKWHGVVLQQNFTLKYVDYACRFSSRKKV